MIIYAPIIVAVMQYILVVDKVNSLWQSYIFWEFLMKKHVFGFPMLTLTKLELLVCHVVMQCPGY